MAWFYEIRDLNESLVETGKEFATQLDALVADTVEADRLKRAGNLPGSGTTSVRSGQDSEAPTRQPRKVSDYADM
jgi:hypothetical protein